MKKYLSIIVLFIFISCTSKIRVKYVYDGDTIITSKNEHIRLAEIDANELNEKGGLEAKQFLSSLIAGKVIEIKREGKGRYGRTIGKLYLNGLYINEYMVISGEAWAYRHHGKIYNEQLQAQKERIGMWRYTGNIEPYLFRKEHKY